ncbi:metalloregulator ArsR/SmtB family transcription factor [Streptosporangium sp. NPDC002524]|uniref:ArsR/SmtB family transcription factor n=1 Tax=Streptosporangium sp. NPDC002524 TaxID=3154537 RepID=UPI00331CA2D2
MQVFEALADPVRRRMVELLAGGEQGAGAVGEIVRAEFGISRPAVSRHLRVLRDSGLVTVRADDARRLYAVEPIPPREVDIWPDRFRRFWSRRLDALGTELARGGREHQDRGRGRDWDRGRDPRENTTGTPPADGPLSTGNSGNSTRNEEDT